MKAQVDYWVEELHKITTPNAPQSPGKSKASLECLTGGVALLVGVEAETERPPTSELIKSSSRVA